MEWTIEQLNLQAIQGEATEHTALHSVLEALLYWRNKFLRNVTTSYLVDELQTTFLEVFVYRTNVYNDISELTTTTRLLLVNLAEVNSLSNSFLVVNLGLTLVTFYLELTLQTVDNDIQVELTHTWDYCLTALFVSLNSKGRIFFSQLSQTLWQLVEVLLSLRLYCDTNNGIGEVHWLEYDRSIFVAKCITSVNILETYTCTNITSWDYFNRVLVVRVHLEQTRYAFLLAWTSVVDIWTSFNLTRVNAEESQTTNVGVSCNLKCERWSVFVFARLAVFLFTSFGVSTYDVGSIKRRRQEHTYVVEQCLNTLVLEWRTLRHRNDIHSQSTLTDSGYNFLFSDRRRIVEELLHQSFVAFSSGFNHLVVPLLSFVLQFSGDVVYFVFSTHCFIVPEDSLHLDKVNDTLEVFFSTDRNWDYTGVSAKNSLHLANHLKEVGTRAVHLVNVTNTGNVILVSLTPYSFRLRFNTTYSTVSCYSAIEHTERTFNLSSKVNVTRSINQVNLVSLIIPVPRASSGSRGNSDTALLFLGHPVHSSATIVNLANLVSLTCVEQDTLRSCSLTGIDVRHDTDVTSQM